MSIGELMEWRYLRAEREKEQVRVFVHVLKINRLNARPFLTII